MKRKLKPMNSCDFDHEVENEVRLLPYCDEGNMIVCKYHYEREIADRKRWNAKGDAVWQLPKWEDLKVYKPE